MNHITIVSPGKTTFKQGEVISREAFDKENERVSKLGEKTAKGMYYNAEGAAIDVNYDPNGKPPESTVVPMYHSSIMERVRQHLGLESWDTSRDKEINRMSSNSLFRHCLEWEGIIGFDITIRDWIGEIYGVHL